jgi:hypothetical protein
MQTKQQKQPVLTLTTRKTLTGLRVGTLVQTTLYGNPIVAVVVYVQQGKNKVQLATTLATTGNMVRFTRKPNQVKRVQLPTLTP